MQYTEKVMQHFMNPQNVGVIENPRWNQMQYTEKVMQHFMNPQNVGVIENPDGYGKVGNPSCGDIMEIFIKVDNNVITDVKFRTFGCASAIASSSISTDMIIGKTVEEALQVTNKAVVDALGGLPAVKMHCSVLAEEAIKMAIEDYISKRDGKKTE